MKAENKKYLIYGGVALLAGSLVYFIYTTINNKPIIVEDRIVGSDEETVTTPTKSNPFTDLIKNQTFPETIGYKPTDLNSFFKK
jgi:hypothetical protein